MATIFPVNDQMRMEVDDSGVFTGLHVEGQRLPLVLAGTNPITGGVEYSFGANKIYSPFISNTPISVTGNGSDQSMFTATIPGGAMGKNGILRVSFDVSHPNNANAKSYRAKLGGVTVWQTATSGNLVLFYGFAVKNKNNTGAQYTTNQTGMFGSNTNDVPSSTVNTDVDQTFQIIGNATVGEVLVLTSVMVEMLWHD